MRGPFLLELPHPQLGRARKERPPHSSMAWPWVRRPASGGAEDGVSTCMDFLLRTPCALHQDVVCAAQYFHCKQHGISTWDLIFYINGNHQAQVLSNQHQIDTQAINGKLPEIRTA